MKKNELLLVVDIGNTHIVLGVFGRGEFVGRWRIATNHVRTIDESWVILSTLFHAAGLDTRRIGGVALSSVVPDLNYVWEKLSERYLKLPPLTVTVETPGTPPVRYVDPSSVGADRLCNTVAAWTYASGPAVVVDFGTATTFDVVDHQGAFIGGVILPGLQTAARQLHERAAKLPKIALAFPKRVIGTSTETAMQSGILFGSVAQVEGLVRRIRDELAQQGVPGEPVVISTGGFGRLLTHKSEVIQVHLPYLVLFGLALVYSKARDCDLQLDLKLLAEEDEGGPANPAEEL